MIVSEHYDLSVCQVTICSDVLSDKEKRKRELEKNLHILKEKKHQLVQALKQVSFLSFFFHEPNVGRDLFNVAIINCSPIYFFSRLIFYLLFQVICPAQEQKPIPGCCCRIALA